MAAYRPKRGTYEIDRIFPELGRVRIKTGTHDKRLADRYEAMLEALPLDTVRLILAKKLSLRATYDAWSTGRMRALPTADSFRDLVTTMRDWVKAPSRPVSATEALHRTRVVNYLEARGGTAARVSALPELFRTMRAEYADRGAAFNRARASGMAFVRDLVGRRHPLYELVADIEVLPEPPKLTRHPCTVGEARKIASELSAPWGPIWWALCCTGMGPKEYWSDGWKAISEGIEINGQKRPARNRIVPLVVVPPAPVGTPAGFAEALDRAALGVTPYDARRSFARWLEEIGAHGYQQDALMGHGPKSMRELYKWGDIRAWLDELGAKLQKHVGERHRGLRVSK